MLDFVAVGDVMLDVRLPPAPPGTRQHTEIGVAAGGSAVNAALAAARLGARAAVVGSVGDDTLGDALAAQLAAAGVLSFLTRIDGLATGTTVYVGDAVVADRGANARAAIAEVPPARVTLVSAYLPTPAREQALRLATGLRAVDLQGVLVDEPAAEVVLGPDLDLEALAPAHDVVCSTLGPNGAVALARGERTAAAPSRVLDEPLVGAGDAFAAGFLLALAGGEPLTECLRRGCDAAIA